MLGYQPWRCLKHNLIADVVRKPRWFLKIVWENFLVNNLLFVCVRIVIGPCPWAIFIILFSGLQCDNSNSLTYEPRKAQSLTLSRANCVILHLNLAFQIKVFNMFVRNFSRDFLRDRLFKNSRGSRSSRACNVLTFFSRIFRSEGFSLQFVFFSEQPIYENYSSLDFYKNNLISYACLLIKMASKTVTRSMKVTFGELIFIVYFNSLFILHQTSEGKTEKWIYGMGMESAMRSGSIFH